MFVKLSDERAKNQKIWVDNIFIRDYMPYAPDLSVKAYLYGLSLALSGMDNSVEMLSSKLGVHADEIISAFKYWENQGLITLVSLSPPMVEYKEVRPISEQIRYFNKAKYKAFNDQLHAMLSGRALTQNEYAEYYNAIETLHIEKEAMLAIIAYCVRLKGESVGYPYILTVARNLAAEGITTFDRVGERLGELDLYDNEVKNILKALGLKRSADVGDKRLWIKWTKNMGFTGETLIKVAKDQKKGGIEKLDSTLTRYYENRVLSHDQIKRYEDEREKLFTLTAQIVKILGKYYDRLDYIIESYTQKWLNYGFEEDALILIADYCFKKNYRDLEGMDGVVVEFYKQGLLTAAAIDDFKAETAGKDEIIKKIFAVANIKRNIGSWDRDAYHTWTYSWKMPFEVIEYAAGLSAGKEMRYINAVLGNWNVKGIHDLNAAKAAGAGGAGIGATVSSKSFATVTQKSSEELDKLFDKISPDDL